MLPKLGHSHSHGHGHSHFSFHKLRELQLQSTAIRLFKFASPELWLLLIGGFSLVISATINLALPYAMGKVFDTDKLSQAKTTIFHLCIIFAVGITFTFLRGFLFSYAGERLVARLRNKLFSHIIIQDVAFFDKNKTGELVNRLSADTTLMQMAATITLAMIGKFLVQVVGGTVALLVLSWRLTFVMLLPVPLIGIMAGIYGRYVKRIGKRVQEALAKCTSVAEEAISSVRYVRSFGNESQESERYAEAIQFSFRLGKHAALANGLFQSGTEFAAYLSIILVIFYGTVLYLNDDISKGELLSFVLYAIYVSHALGALSGQIGEFMRAVGASERVFELLDRKPEINITGGITIENLEGKISFKNVDFSYPARSDIPILKNFSLELRPGTVTALVGPSGGGKTTVALLILRLYDAQHGDIYVDDTMLTAVDPKWLREQIGFVSQEPVLFNTSIKENISYGKPGASDSQIEEAARLAEIHDFIVQLPEGYDTIVGERGVRLSGGQKQRIAIARAILKEPKILLLDEATSALDSQNERLIQSALDRLMKNRTVLVIAHRLSTVKRADSIAVIAGGEIVEQGPHDELIKNSNGLYHKLASNQFNDHPIINNSQQLLDNNSNNGFHSEHQTDKKSSSRKDKPEDQVSLLE